MTSLFGRVGYAVTRAQLSQVQGQRGGQGQRALTLKGHRRALSCGPCLARLFVLISVWHLRSALNYV